MSISISGGHDVDILPAVVLAVSAGSRMRVYQRCRVIRMCSRS